MLSREKIVGLDLVALVATIGDEDGNSSKRVWKFPSIIEFHAANAKEYDISAFVLLALRVFSSVFSGK